METLDTINRFGTYCKYFSFFNKAFLPLAFNLHFVIMIVYYGSYWLVNMKDLDTIENKNIDTGLMIFHQNINHFVPFLLWFFICLLLNSINLYLQMKHFL